eukprot:445192-Ditylum_brightwellii.AAC.1
MQARHSVDVSTTTQGKNGLAGLTWLLCLQLALLIPNTLSPNAEHSRALLALGCPFLCIRHAVQ